jgi:hypothetical protein
LEVIYYFYIFNTTSSPQITLNTMVLAGKTVLETCETPAGDSEETGPRGRLVSQGTILICLVSHYISISAHLVYHDKIPPDIHSCQTECIIPFSGDLASSIIGQ